MLLCFLVACALGHELFPQYRADQGHSGYSSYESTIDKTNVAHLQQLWHQRVGTPHGIVSSVSVVWDVAYVNSQDGNMYSFDADTGSRISVFPTGGPGISQPAVSDGPPYFIYVSNAEGMVAFDRLCTTPLCPVKWKRLEANGVNPAPLLAEDAHVVALSTKRAAIDVLRDDTGKEVWSAAVNPVRYPVIDSASFAQGLIVVPGEFGVIAYNLTCSSPCPPAYTVSTFHSVRRVVALASEGVTAGGAGYATTAVGDVYAFNLTSGAQLWRARTHVEGISAAAVANGVVLVSTGDNFLVAFEADCAAVCPALWRGQIVGALKLSDPLIANGLAYVGTTEVTGGTIRIFDMGCPRGTLCQPLRTIKTAGAVVAAPTVVDGMVYATTVEGDVYAYGLKDRRRHRD